jgi:ribosomal protein L29
MNGSRLTAVCLAALALVLPAAACGGDDSDQFREDYNAAVERLSSINSDIGSAAGGAAGQSNDAIAREFDKIADTAEQTRSDLAELDPPDDAKEEFDTLLASLERGVDDLRAVASAAKSDNPAEANEAVRDLARTGREITEAENALKKAVDG